MNKQEIQDILNMQLALVNSDKLNAVIEAINENNLSYVKENAISLNDELQGVALIYSITNDKLEIVMSMIDNNHRLLENPDISKLALMYYAVENNVKALEYFYSKDIKVSKEDLYDTLVQACERKSEDAVRLILKKENDINFADIISTNNNVVNVEDDLEKEVTENRRRVLPALDINAMRTRLGMYFEPINIKRVDTKEITQRCIDLFEMLLKNGIRTSIKSEYGKTPLQYVLDTKNGQLITKILDHHAYTRYNKKSALGYDLRDLHIAKEDLNRVLKSEWYKKVKEQKEALKEDIKAIIHCENDDELKKVVSKIAKKRQLDEINKSLENNEDIRVISESLKATLKRKLNKTNNLLQKVKRFKDRIELNTKEKVFEVINLCKKKEIKNLSNRMKKINL